MSATRPVRREQGFVYDHPALIASLLGIAITATFLYALYQGTQGHHEGGRGPAEHGAAPAGSGAMPAAPAH